MLPEWETICQKSAETYDKFVASLGDFETTQKELLNYILNHNAVALYGGKYKFSEIKSYQAYSENVPIVTYENIEPLIQSIIDGNTIVLTKDSVELFEMTGGSSGGAKYIPYTAEALASFKSAIIPWVYDLIMHRPAISEGHIYFSISPPSQARNIPECKIPIGIENDGLYFGKELAPYLSRLCITPNDIGKPASFNDWRILTSIALLAREDLTFISVWSPTFLTSLIEYITQHKGQIIQCLARGQIELSTGTSMFNANLDRVSILDDAIGKHQVDTKAIWPKLDTISCWMDGGSKLFAKELQQLFPHTNFQAKGLLSTECAVSVPLGICDYPVLAPSAAFYEFIDESGDVHPGWELQEGKTYAVVITTPSGLYRYQTGDSVKIMGFFQQTPQIQFVGRTQNVSDLCGEKLTESFLIESLEYVFSKISQTQIFFAPATKPKPHYDVYIDPSKIDTIDKEDLEIKLELALSHNPQYAYARKLGQLDPVNCSFVKNLQNHYIAHALSAGQSIGDIKIPTLLEPQRHNAFLTALHQKE